MLKLTANQPSRLGGFIKSGGGLSEETRPPSADSNVQSTGTHFTDVPERHGASGAVQQLASKGIFIGYPTAEIEAERVRRKHHHRSTPDFE